MFNAAIHGKHYYLGRGQDVVCREAAGSSAPEGPVSKNVKSVITHLNKVEHEAQQPE